METPVAHRRHQTKPQWSGWLVLASAPVLLLAGLVRADEAMTALGLLQGIWFFAADRFARSQMRHLRCALLSPRHVESGRAFCWRLQMHNQSRWLDAWAIHVELKIGSTALGRAEVFRIPAGGIALLDLETTIEQRGEVGEVDLITESHAPFGLMRTRSESLHPVHLLVRPKPVWPWKLDEQGDQGSHPGEHSWLEGWQSEGEPRGVRPWHPGDKPRSIVWPASLRSIAQGSTWMVRDADPPGNGWAGYTVVFHSYGGGGSLIRPGRFEEAMGHVAGVVRGLVAQGRQVTLIADFHDWHPCPYRDLACVGKCLDLLAMASRCPSTEAHELVEIIDRVPPAQGLIVLSDFPASAWLDVLPKPRGHRLWTRPERVRSMRRKEGSR